MLHTCAQSRVVDRAQVVADLGVLTEIDPGKLLGLRDPEADGLVDDGSQDPADHEGVDQHREGTDALAPQLIQATAVEEAGHASRARRVGEETNGQGTEQAADEVDPHDVE